MIASNMHFAFGECASFSNADVVEKSACLDSIEMLDKNIVFLHGINGEGHSDRNGEGHTFGDGDDEEAER